MFWYISLTYNDLWFHGVSRLYHVSYSTIPLLSMVSRTIYKSRDDFCDEVTHFLNIGPGLVRKTILCPGSMGDTAKLYL